MPAIESACGRGSVTPDLRRNARTEEITDATLAELART
jgi:hypothetical protein